MSLETVMQRFVKLRANRSVKAENDGGASAPAPTEGQRGALLRDERKVAEMIFKAFLDKQLTKNCQLTTGQVLQHLGSKIATAQKSLFKTLLQQACILSQPTISGTPSVWSLRPHLLPKPGDDVRLEEGADKEAKRPKREQSTTEPQREGPQRLGDGLSPRLDRGRPEQAAPVVKARGTQDARPVIADSGDALAEEAANGASTAAAPDAHSRGAAAAGSPTVLASPPAAGDNTSENDESEANEENESASEKACTAGETPRPPPRVVDESSGDESFNSQTFA